MTLSKLEGVGDGSEAPDADGSRGLVLLVDDEPTIVRGFARILTSAGFSVQIAHDGREAAELARGMSFDAIVSDIAMPEMTGLQLLRSVREHDLDVPVILMTGGPAVESAVQAMEYGALRYLIKPVDSKQLEEVVARATRLHQMAKIKREALELFRLEGKHLGDRAGLEARFANAINTLWLAFQPIVSWTDEIGHRLRGAGPQRGADPARPAGSVRGGGAARPPARARAHHPRPRGQDAGRQPDRRRRGVRQRARARARRRLAAGADRRRCRRSPSAWCWRSPSARRSRRSRTPTRASRSCARWATASPSTISAPATRGSPASRTSSPRWSRSTCRLIRGLDQSPTKQKLLRSIVGLCRDLEIKMIAEGIETVEERDTLVRLGGDLCQGYLFARPGRAFPPIKI